MKNNGHGCERLFIIFLSTVFLLPLIPFTVLANIPPKTSYQGYLSDSMGTPIHGSLSIAFSIYDVETGGTALWTETQSVSVNDGIFNVQLGSTPINLAFDVPYYLGVKVGSDPEMTPRKPLTSVPYAYRAKTVEVDHDTLANLSCSGGNVPRWNGSTWECGDAGTNYTAGTGLTLTGGQFNVDTNVIQARVSQPCNTGYAVQGINAEGIVICVPVATVTASPSDAAAMLDGGTSAGTSLEYSRGDHKHGIGNGVITGAYIQDGTVTNADVSSSAAIEFSKLSGVASATHNHDSAYVKLNQPNSINSAMIVDGSITFADIGQNSCSPGQIMKWNGSAWACAGDNDTTYTAGLGLNLTGTQFNVDTSVIQARVNGTCGAGNAIRVIHADGTVTCEPAAAGWSLTGNSGTNPSLNFLGTTDEKPLELRVNNTRALRIEWAGADSVFTSNMIGGNSHNAVTPARVGGTIGGGGRDEYPNLVLDHFGTVGGGVGNRAGSNLIGSTWGATVSGGAGNTADGTNATIGGGTSNTASGASSTIPGGSSNSALGTASFAAGRRAKANNRGCFVWGDSDDSDVTCNTDNQWVARASGGVRFYTNTALTSGVKVDAGGGSWASISDRALKENFAPVDGQEILTHLAAIPISVWNYKSQNSSIRHMGPTAQEFYAAFGLGEDDKHITTVDADGVALAAIQGLHQLVKELKTDNASLKMDNEMLRKQMSILEQRLMSLEGRMANR